MKNRGLQEVMQKNDSCFLIGFIVSTVSIVDTIFEKQFFYLCLQMGYFVATMLEIYILKNHPFDHLIVVIAFISCVHYLVNFTGLVLFIKGR